MFDRAPRKLRGARQLRDSEDVEGVVLAPHDHDSRGSAARSCVQHVGCAAILLGSPLLAIGSYSLVLDLPEVTFEELSQTITIPTSKPMPQVCAHLRPVRAERASCHL